MDPQGDAPERTAARRARFRESLSRVARQSSSGDLVRWLLVPGSIALLAGFVLMFLGWWGASRTFRQIEQIPYLISGGLIGLGLVVVGTLLLATTVWIVLLGKFQTEAEARSQERMLELEARVAALTAAIAPTNGASEPAPRTGRRRLTPDKT